MEIKKRLLMNFKTIGDKKIAISIYGINLLEL